jgi:hypothetical protein
MQDYSESAREELKRIDHLVYVSLKYTRTVDVLKSIIDRLISCINYIITDLLEHKENEIIEVPKAPAGQATLIKKLYHKDPLIMEMIDFYTLLRKLTRAEYTKRQEFRRHVTMVTTVEGQIIDINIDVITEYYAKTKVYWEKIEKNLRGSDE